MVIAVPTHKIAYMAVPKAACSSVKAGLALIDPEVDLSEAQMAKDIMLVHRTYPTARFRRHRWQDYAGWWRFCVVRDPIKRLMSVYTDLVAGRGIIGNSPRLKDPACPLPVDPDPDFFYQNLKGYMAHASVIKHHALPVSRFIGPTPLDYDRVYRVEEMDDLAQDLSTQAGTQAHIPRFNKSKQKLSFDALKPETRDSLRGYLELEYAALDGLYPSPF